MSVYQIVGLVVAAVVAAAAFWKRENQGPTLVGCAEQALHLASKLRELECPEGIAQCQELINVIMEHQHGLESDR